MLLRAAVIAVSVLLSSTALADTPADFILPGGWGNSTLGMFAFKRSCSRCHSFSETFDATPQTGTCFVDGVRMFNYLKRQMPRDAKGSLSDPDVYSLIAYILTTKKLIGRNDIINSKTLPLVAFPNNGTINAGCPLEAGGRGFDKFAPLPKDYKPEFIPAPAPLRGTAAPATPPAPTKPVAKLPAKQPAHSSLKQSDRPL
jgi:hypothetical protein